MRWSVERDPRKDPRPGDVVLYGPQWQQERAEVTKVWANGDVDYAMNDREFQIHRSGWWNMMQSAEVLHVAGA
jgi:hypothetical protein